MRPPPATTVRLPAMSVNGEASNQPTYCSHRPVASRADAVAVSCSSPCSAEVGRIVTNHVVCRLFGPLLSILHPDIDVTVGFGGLGNWRRNIEPMREAIVHLATDQLEALGIDEFVRSGREAGLEDVSELRCGRPGCLLVIEVAEPIDSARFSSIPNLEWWAEVANSGCTTYLCKLDVPAVGEQVVPHHESDVSQTALDATEEGIDITLVGEQDALADRVDEFSAAGTNPVLRTLTNYGRPHDPVDALTARQREVLALAYGRGYFDTPRKATTGEIGTALGIDGSTVREHLQRAQKNLVADGLDGT
jgi:DNA-binding CsgD family transcriptional regulator